MRVVLYSTEACDARDLMSCNVVNHVFVSDDIWNYRTTSKHIRTPIINIRNWFYSQMIIAAYLPLLCPDTYNNNNCLAMLCCCWDLKCHQYCYVTGKSVNYCCCLLLLSSSFVAHFHSSLIVCCALPQRAAIFAFIIYSLLPSSLYHYKVMCFLYVLCIAPRGHIR